MLSILNILLLELRYLVKIPKVMCAMFLIMVLIIVAISGMILTNSRLSIALAMRLLLSKPFTSSIHWIGRK